MKKRLRISLTLLVGMPICLQSLIGAPEIYPLNQASNLFMKTAKNASATRVLPKGSKLFDYRINTFSPYNVSYDWFGHEISVIEPTGLTNEVHEYDVTGKILLNKYTEKRKNISDSWTKPEKYDIRTIINSEGVRTAIQHEDYTSIKLNDQGLVTYCKTKASNGTTTEETLTWSGYQLTRVSSSMFSFSSAF